MRLTSKLILINYKILPQVLVAIAGFKFKALTKNHIFLTNFSANGGSFLYGISLGWSSTSEPEVLSANHKFVMTEKEFSWSVSMMCLGAAMSCVISGIIRNRFGTKLTIFVFAVPNLLGWFLIIFAWTPMMVS